MSKFEDIFHSIHLNGGLSRQHSDESKEFIKQSFAYLDAWMKQADDGQQQLAFEYTQTHTPCATVAMWWFEQEQKQPQRWSNSWNAAQFVQDIEQEDLLYIAPEKVLARIDWALQCNDWNFFTPWEMPFIRQNVSSLCYADLNSPVVAKTLKEMATHDIAGFEWTRDEIPTQYIQLHTSIIPDGACLLHQRDIIAKLDTNDPLDVLACLEQYTGAPALGTPQAKLVNGLRGFLHNNEKHKSKKKQNALPRICDRLVALFPNHPDSVVPGLKSNYFDRWSGNCDERWKIQANMFRPIHLQWFVAGETEKMLRALAMSTDCNMNAWVEFWKDIFSIENWTPEMSNAGDRPYDFRRPYPYPLDVETIKKNIAPHWDFFEQNAPKMGRALAGVVQFYGGYPPLSLCDFSNIFNFNSGGNPPPGFPQFIEEQIEQQALIAEAHAQRKTLNDCIDTSLARGVVRKM